MAKISEWPQNILGNSCDRFDCEFFVSAAICYRVMLILVLRKFHYGRKKVRSTTSILVTDVDDRKY